MEQKVVKNNKKKIYMKNNNLVKSKYDLTSSENKLYTFLSDKIKQDNKDNDIEHYKVKFKREETFPFISSTKLRQANKISMTLSKLMKKTIFIADKKSNGKEFWGEYAFLSYYEYYPETDEFIVDMNVRVSELIVEHYLKNGYTPLNLDVIYNLNSIYAQRFYELIRLVSWKGEKITYELNELKSYLLLDKKKSYNNFGNLKKKVIEPAIKELNDSNMIKVSYKEIKVKNKVTAIEFSVHDLDERVYFSRNNNSNNNIIENIYEEKPNDISLIEYNNNSNNNNNIIIEKEPESEIEVFIPDKSVFTPAVAKKFKIDFKYYDFHDEDYQDLFNETVMFVTEKENSTKIKAKSYNLFRKMLKTKIDNYDNKRGEEFAQLYFSDF